MQPPLVLLVVVVMMALMAIGINIGPVIAAAGALGIAMCLSAQSRIKDFTSPLCPAGREPAS